MNNVHFKDLKDYKLTKEKEDTEWKHCQTDKTIIVKKKIGGKTKVQERLHWKQYLQQHKPQYISDLKFHWKTNRKYF